MDKKYPTLKRPKKKLVFPATNTCVSNQWVKDIVSLDDVDKMFDDLDSKGEDFPSQSPEIHIPKHKERIVVGNGDHTPASPELDIDSENPFKTHGPIKTSSPIEGNLILHKNYHRKMCGSASPILFDCSENQALEMANKPSEKSEHNNHRKDESDDSFFETLPKKSAFDKMSAHKAKTAPVRLKPSCPALSPVKLEVPPEKQTESIQVPPRVKHDMTSFLQKLKDATQPKSARVGLLPAKVMPPVPEPEPEDDFLILEDDGPLYVSIPSKTAKSVKEKQSKTPSSDKETKGTPEEKSTDVQQGTDLDHRNQESLTLPKKNKKKTNVSESNTAASDKDQKVPTTVESKDKNNPLHGSKIKKKNIQIKKGPSKEDNNPECKSNHTDTDEGKLSKKTENQGENTVENKESKSVQYNVNPQRRTTPAKKSRKAANKDNAVADGPEEQPQEVNCENQTNDDSPISDCIHFEAKSSGDLEDVEKKHTNSSSVEKTSDEVLGKRKRKPTGEWWLISPQSPPQQHTQKQRLRKKTKHAKKDSSTPLVSPVKATTGAKNDKLKPSSSSSSDGQMHEAEKKKVKKGKQKKVRPVKRTPSENTDEVFCQSSQDKALNKDSDRSPFSLFPHIKRRISSGENKFPKVYPSSTEKLFSAPDHALPTRPGGVPSSAKRRLKSPGNWWQVNTTPEDHEALPSQPQQQKRKAAGKNKKQAKKPAVCSAAKPLEGAPKQKKRSLATYSDLCSTVTVSPLVSKETKTKLKKQNNINSPTEDTEAASNVVSMEGMEECQKDTIQELVSRMSKFIRSGPSSMIGLENFEDEDEDIVLSVLPSTTVQPALGVFDMCAPPLKPLVLHPEDNVNLLDWLKSLWPTTDSKKRGPEITPDHFEWYCYQGRALGVMVDLLSGPFCNGKMLLGSFMKKPLWVDHSATTVFNLLTSCVSLIMDCNKSCYSAGQSFMVPSGHAYSIHNLSAQPAVFYFTRVFAEESDE